MGCFSVAHNNPQILENGLDLLLFAFAPTCKRRVHVSCFFLNAILNQQILDYEGLSTLLIEVESIINSRPITQVSEDPKDLEASTPSHLLLLRSEVPLTPGVFRKKDLYPKGRWRQVQYLADQFWKRWSKEYLPLLQTRSKWHQEWRNLSIGDIVLLVDNICSRNAWPLARIVETFSNSII